MAAKRITRHHTDEFRKAAVARLAAGENNVAVAKDLGITSSLLSEWKRKIDSGKGFKSLKYYDENFKLKAIARLENEKRMDVAADLGVYPGLLTAWKAAFAAGTLPSSGGGPLPKQSNIKRRKKYSPKFKADAVALIKKIGLVNAAKKVRIHSGMLSNWRSTAEGRNTGSHGKAAKKKIGQKKSYYVPVAKRREVEQTQSAQPERAIAVTHAVTLLRGVRSKVDVGDPVHLAAMLALATLEGKM